MKPRPSIEAKEAFIELRALGKSFRAIAAELGVSKPTLIAWSRELATEIANAKALRLDELAQRFAVAKAKRLEVFGRRLEAILEELDKRDLSEVPTAALLKLALEYGDRLKAEDAPLVLAAPTDAAEAMPPDWIMLDRWQA